MRAKNAYEDAIRSINTEKRVLEADLKRLLKEKERAYYGTKQSYYEALHHKDKKYVPSCKAHGHKYGNILIHLKDCHHDYVKDAKGRNGQDGKDYHVGYDVLDFEDA